MDSHLIIGDGEVGQALLSILEREHNVSIRDVEPAPERHMDVLHICFPDSEQFVRHVKAYQSIYTPNLTIIHSSVKVGTTDQCGDHVVYSPIRGRHPHLVKEMPKFVKFVGGHDINDVDKACAIFEACGWRTQLWDDPTTLELLKLLSNVHMGLEIAWRQEVERMGCDGEAYGLWEESYRAGYAQLGQHNLIRPQMRPDAIGGHCIVECTKILQSSFKSKALDFILESNAIAESNEQAKEAHYETRHQDPVAR